MARQPWLWAGLTAAYLTVNLPTYILPPAADRMAGLVGWVVGLGWAAILAEIGTALVLAEAHRRLDPRGEVLRVTPA